MNPMPLTTTLCLFVMFAPLAMAQFAGDDDLTADNVQTALDEFNAALRAPLLDPVDSRPAEKDDCDFEPEVAAALRASKLAEDEDCPQYLGRLSANPYSADSTSNPYSAAGSPYSPTSVNNAFSPYGSAFSSTSARNPYATDAPKIIAQDGTYLGKLSDNPYDPDSVSNPYGRYGSPYSPTSINNPYSTYGSPYSSQSPNNPYATQAPLLFGE